MTDRKPQIIMFCFFGISMGFLMYLYKVELLETFQPYNHFTVREEITSRTWRAVGQLQDVFVFSAYFNKEEHTVEVVGLIERQKAKANFTCTFRTSSMEKLDHVQGYIEFIDKTLSHIMYHTVHVICPVPKTFKPPNVEVQLENHTTSLRIIYNPPRIHNFTVCFPSLYGRYSNYLRVIETIETDMLFGANYFVVYNKSISPQVDTVLRHYMAKGLMEVIQWEAPVRLYYHGQWAFIQDCHLASRYKSKYVVVKDLDELIVPHKHKNWFELLREAESDNPKIASHGFQNSFFRTKWEQDKHASAAARKLNIESLLYTWRENKIYPKMRRCKVIIHPEHVRIAGIHHTMKFVEGYEERFFEPDVAYLHHYRKGDAAQERFKDSFMNKYADTLITRINNTLKEVGLEEVSSEIRRG